MGRSRGGLTTKIHALVDANGMPIRLKLTEGQAHDGKSAADLIATLATGQILLADRAYDSDALRESLAARGAWANVKPISRRRTKPPFCTFLYRYRNLVERFFNKLKHFRAIATRFEKHDANYLALLKLASAKIWMRLYELLSERCLCSGSEWTSFNVARARRRRDGGRRGISRLSRAKLFALLRERIAANDAGGASRLARRISNGLMTRARSTGRSASDAPGMSAPISG